MWKFPSLPSTLELLSWLISRSHAGAENIWRKTYMEFTCHPKKNKTFSEPFTKPAGHFQASNGPKQWTHIVIWPRKKHTHTHTLTPDPCLGKQNAPLELWRPLLLLNLMAAALILQRFRFLGEPVSSLFCWRLQAYLFISKEIHYPPTQVKKA